jgi:hypothetical protein
MFPKLVRILLKINFQASFVFFRLFYALLLDQLADMLEVFMVLPVLSSTPPKYQEAAPTYCAQFGLLYKLYNEEFPLAVLHATVQHIKHPFHTVLPDDGQ